VSRPPEAANLAGGSPPRMPAAARVSEIGVFLLFLAVAFLLQKAGGAYSSEMGHYPDEAAHYITGLMVRDYLASGFPGNPVTFAERFYARFPKVAFGVWPPLFHGILGVWLLPAPDGRSSALLLMALITAAASYLLYRCVRQVAGRISALTIGLLLALLPISQLMTSTIMADSLVMLTELAAAALLAKWFRSGSNRDAWWVGVAVGLACMTKGNAVAVILAVPLAIAFTRRFDLLRKSGIYVGGLIAAALAFGWELHALELDRNISTFNGFSFAGFRAAFVFFLPVPLRNLGMGLVRAHPAGARCCRWLHQAARGRLALVGIDGRGRARRFHFSHRDPSFDGWALSAGRHRSTDGLPRPWRRADRPSPAVGQDPWPVENASGARVHGSSLLRFFFSRSSDAALRLSRSRRMAGEESATRRALPGCLRQLWRRWVYSRSRQPQ